MIEGTNPNRSALEPNFSPKPTSAEQTGTQVKAQIDSAVTTVKDQVRETVDSAVGQVRGFDLRQQVDARPWTSLGVAVLTGYLLGNIDPSSDSDYSSLPSRSSAAHAWSNQLQGRAQGTQRGGMWSAVVDQFGGELRTITTATISAAVATLRDTIKESVPQFAQEYERRINEQAPEPTATPLGDAPPADGFNGGPTEIGNGGMRTGSGPSYVNRSQPIDPSI